jgi:crotonobetainyl-CoA:carnitine CoA-transferase CaiB-like acyl-CoA transferase
MEDPQYQALGSIATVADPELGALKMQNVIFRLSDAPGAIHWAGRNFDAGADAVVLDLEDAVPLNQKLEARRMVANVLSEPLPE